MMPALSSRRDTLTAAVWVAAVGVLVGAFSALEPLYLLAVPLAVLWLLILADWRRGVLALLCVLPFAGIPAFVSESPYALLTKDIAIVLPLYVSFALAFVGERKRLTPDGDIVAPLMCAFGFLVIAIMMLSPSLSIGMIGAKVWIAYLPMYVIGYQYVRRTEDAVTILRLTALLALAPASLGIAEWIVAATTGDFNPFIGIYGPLAEDVRREVTFHVLIARIPSTFTSAHHYYNFELAALAAALALWLSSKRTGWGLVVFVLALATIASGLRRAWLIVPLVIGLAMLIAKTRPSTRVAATMAGAGLLVAFYALGVDLVAIASEMPSFTAKTLSFALHGEFIPSLSGGGLMGGGTGLDTNAALRYGNAGGETKWVENWYAKAVLELGALGLILVAALMFALLRQSLARISRMDAYGRQMAAPLLAMLVATALALFKAPELDWDPMNVYFWLFAGVIAGIFHARQGRG